MILISVLGDVYRKCRLRIARNKAFQVGSSNLSPNSSVKVIFCVAGFRPGRRSPFVPAKGLKTIDAPSGLIERMDASLKMADQLAPLKQGPPGNESVPPLDQTAGVGAWKTNLSGTNIK